jgi:hypothetical protein
MSGPAIVFNPFTQNFDFVGASGGGTGTVQFLAGNDAANVPPDGFGVINVIGANGINITGDIATNTLTVTGSGASGVIWINVTGASATMSAGNGYEANRATLVTLTMPSVGSSTFGDTIKIAGFGAGGFLVQCVATQLIHFGNTATSAGGSLASNNRYDQLELVCSTTTTEWFVRNSVGNLTPA